MPFFPPGGIQWHACASYMLPCQTSFCQTSPLLSSVTQQQHEMEYWWEVSVSIAIPPRSTSDIVDQHHKIGDITFGAALIFLRFTGFLKAMNLVVLPSGTRTSHSLCADGVMTTFSWANWTLENTPYNKILDPSIPGHGRQQILNSWSIGLVLPSLVHSAVLLPPEHLVHPILLPTWLTYGKTQAYYCFWITEISFPHP